MNFRVLEIEFTDDDKDLNPLVDEFNDLCTMLDVGKVLEMTHYDLAKTTKIPSATKWKRFLLNPKIKNWYESERALLLNSQIQTLIRTVPSEHSTGAVQALNTLLNQQKAMEEQQEQRTLIIYNFIPLTEEERKNPNINVHQNIPSGVRRAISFVNRNASNN